VGKKSPRVGLISFGALEDKVPLILSPLVLSAGVTLTLYKNYVNPEAHVGGLLRAVHSVLQKKELTGIVFDLRVSNWPDVHSLIRARNLSRSLQNICDNLKINSSVFVTNAHQPLGNAVGAPLELLEASEVLKGNGPFDLTKFVLEVGTDLLLLTKKFKQRSKAKKFLKDNILEGKSVVIPKYLNEDFPCAISVREKMRISSRQKGYVRHISMKILFRIKSELVSSLSGNGFTLLKKIGDRVEKEDHLVEAFPSKGQHMHPLEWDILEAFFISPNPPDFQPLILERSEIRMQS